MTLVTRSDGRVLRRNRYTDGGMPRTNNLGRFGYTGQAKLGYRADGDADETELWLRLGKRPA